MSCQSNPEKQNNKAESIILRDFRLYYKATVIKTVWYWYKTRHRDEWNKIEPRNKSTHLLSINLQQRGQECTMDKRQSLWCWENWTATCKRMKSEHSLTPYIKITQNGDFPGGAVDKTPHSQCRGPGFDPSSWN